MTNSDSAMMSRILQLNMKLDDLEMKLAQNSDDKDNLITIITNTRESILPIRLELNNFIHMVSNISDDKNGDTNIDKFNNVRDILFKLNDSIQLLSKRFGELRPLFDTVGEYTKEYKTKEYQPLETLGNLGTEINADTTTHKTASSAATATVTATATATTSTTTTTTSGPTQKKGRGSTAGVKSPVSVSNTPTTTTAITTAAATPTTTTTKKPRKPRQKKNTTSAKNTPATAHATTTTNNNNNNSNSVVATPSSATIPNAGNNTTMNPTLSVPPQLMANLQNNIQGIPSPIQQNLNTGGITPMSQQIPFNNNNNNSGSNGNRPNSVQQSPLHSNTIITPANILSMNMSSGNGGNNGNNQSNNNGMMNMSNNNNNNNQGPNAMNDFGNLDLNNIDLSSLNMDFL